MSEYKTGDKVVVRKDLNLYEYYGCIEYDENLTILPLCEYVEIKFVEDDEPENIKYLITGNIWISEEMIEGLYVDSLLEYKERNKAYRQQLSDEYSSLLAEYYKLNKLIDKLTNNLIIAVEDMNTSYFDKLSEELDLTLCTMKVNTAKSSTIDYVLDLHRDIVK